MPNVYSQRRNDPVIVLIAEGGCMEGCREYIADTAKAWIRSKPGRTAKQISGLELGLMFSDGKMACSLWVEPFPVPAGETPLTPATGPVPGLEVKP